MRRLKVQAQRLSIEFVLLAALTPAAHAQVPPLGDGSLNNPAGTPAARTPLLTYGVAAGVGESDNVTLVSTDKISQTIAAADVDFSVKDHSRLLDVDAAGKFAYLDYLQHAYNSQLTGRFDGEGEIAVVPQRLTWVVRDNFGQAAIDPYSPVTPSNTEDVNYFSTGPDLFLRLGGLDFVTASARYARTQYQTSPYDSNRGLGSLSIGREVSAAASVSLNVNFERAMFANTVANTDFDRTGIFGRYELKGARTDFEGDLGGSRVTQQGGSTTGPLARVRLSRALSPAARLTFAAGREPTDAASSFSTPQTGALGGRSLGAAPGATTSSSYTKNFASVGWQFVRNRTTIGLLAQWEMDSYPDLPKLDVHRTSTEFTIERRLTRALTAQLLGRLHQTDYPNASIVSNTASSNYDDWLVAGALIWRPGRALEIRLNCDHTARSVAAGSSGYSENRAFLTVGYRPAPLAD